MLAALWANTYRDEKKRAKPFTVKDFMPRWDPEDAEPEQTPDEQMDIMKGWSDMWKKSRG